VLRGEVVFLFEVSAEVVGVFAVAAAEEFPVALADGGLGDPAPIEGVVRGRGDFAGEVGQEIYAVEVAGLSGGMSRRGVCSTSPSRHRAGRGFSSDAANGQCGERLCA
jgi:hypothetical protein